MKKFLLLIILSTFTISIYAQQSVNITVTDSLGSAIANAEVVIYNAERNWRIDSARYKAHPYLTNSSGVVSINNLDTGTYWFNIKHNYRSNRFTVTNLTLANSPVSVTVPIRDLSQNERYLCGICDNKTWITDSIVIFGVSQPYSADSKLLSDATWWDSNDNHGFWWYNSDETKLSYDYDDNSSNGGGSSVEASNIILTDTSFVGEMTMLGMPVTYYMSVQYDTINLSLSGRDTTLHLSSNGSLDIIAYDLNLDHDYCFTCNYTLSKSSFTTSDLGVQDVIITMIDRCGNIATDTITITIAPYVPVGIQDLSVEKIKLYPNPATDILNIQSENESIQLVSIYSVDGKMIKEIVLNQRTHTIDISDLEKGYYLIRIKLKNSDVLQKFIVN